VAEEAEEAAHGVVLLHEMSTSVFLSVGLDLEEQQYVEMRKVIHTTNVHSSQVRITGCLQRRHHTESEGGASR